jgi:hypothetical protein
VTPAWATERRYAGHFARKFLVSQMIFRFFATAPGARLMRKSKTAFIQLFRVEADSRAFRRGRRPAPVSTFAPR